MAVLEDSEDKIIERLGDCDKVPVDYMDLLTYRVRCRKIEIFHYDDEVSFTPNEEEEEQESYHLTTSEDRTDDEDQTLLLLHDLDCLIRRIEQMQLIIKQRKEAQQELDISEEASPEEQSEESAMPQLGVFEFKVCKGKTKVGPKVVPPELEQLAVTALPRIPLERVPFTCDDQLEVRNLKHTHHRIQCQIDEIICNYRLIRSLLAKMRRQMCENNRRLRKMADVSNDCRQWCLSVSKELNVCNERYMHLLKVKISKEEAVRVINAHAIKARKFSTNFLTYRQLRYEMREFHAELNELMLFKDQLSDEIIRRFTNIDTKIVIQVNIRANS